jgi:transmembrane 9 superfamily protein 2/4
MISRCSEDYRWWWKSFVVSGSTALYVFAYSIWYFAKLESNMAITYMLYFGYMSVICMGFFLVTGTMGFLSTYLFNYVIYSSIKVD